MVCAWVLWGADEVGVGVIRVWRNQDVGDKSLWAVGGRGLASVQMLREGWELHCSDVCVFRARVRVEEPCCRCPIM